MADTAAAAGYQFTEREALQYLIRLDRLKVIELQPGNRVRLLVSRHFSWRPGGPVQKHIFSDSAFQHRDRNARGQGTQWPRRCVS